MKLSAVFVGVVSFLCLCGCDTPGSTGTASTDGNRRPGESGSEDVVRPEKKRVGKSGEFLGKPYEVHIRDVVSPYGGGTRIVVEESSASMFVQIDGDNWTILQEPGQAPILAGMNKDNVVQVLKRGGIASVKPDKTDVWGDYYQLDQVKHLVVAPQDSWVKAYTSKSIERIGSSIRITWGEPTDIGKALSEYDLGSVSYDIRSNGFKLVSSSTTFELQE